MQKETPSAGCRLLPGGYSEIWMIAYPLIITNASHTVMQFVDRKFLAMNSTLDVAAAMPGGILCFTMFTFFMATTGFTNAIVSQYYGAGDKISCARAPWAGACWAILAGIICTFVLSIPGEFFIELGGHEPEVRMRELVYFETLIPSGCFIFLTVAFSAFFAGRGKTWYIAGIHFMSSALNIFLDYVLIFGKLGFPELGIAGAGIGTTLACVFSAALAFILFLLTNQEKYPTRKQRIPRFDDIKRLMKFGMPSGVEVFFSVASFTVTAFLIGRLGNASLAANTIAVSINMMSFLPLLGMSEATGIISGKYIGRGEHDISEAATYRSWKMSICYMALMSFIFLVFPELLFGFFRPEKSGPVDFGEIMSYSRPLLACAALFNLFNVTRFIFLGALSGAGDTRVPMLIVMLCAWGILVPGVLFIILYLQLSVIAVWGYMVFYLFILSSLIFLRFYSGAWRRIDLIKRKPIPAEALDLETDSPHIR